MTVPVTGFVVVCDDRRSRVFATREQADAHATDVEKLAARFTAGCHLEHRIEEVDR